MKLKYAEMVVEKNGIPVWTHCTGIWDLKEKMMP